MFLEAHVENRQVYLAELADGLPETGRAALSQVVIHRHPGFLMGRALSSQRLFHAFEQDVAVSNLTERAAAALQLAAQAPNLARARSGIEQIEYLLKAPAGYAGGVNGVR